MFSWRNKGGIHTADTVSERTMLLPHTGAHYCISGVYLSKVCLFFFLNVNIGNKRLNKSLTGSVCFHEIILQFTVLLYDMAFSEQR